MMHACKDTPFWYLQGETIRIIYNKKDYDIDVVDVKPRDHGAISIVDADVNVDFEGKIRSCAGYILYVAMCEVVCVTLRGSMSSYMR